MKIVIDIDEERYKDIQRIAEVQLDRRTDTVEQIVAKGTPLPKNHGRLIDYSWVVDNVIKKLGIKDKRYLLEAEKALMSIIEIAPTIIEAESEEEICGYVSVIRQKNVKENIKIVPIVFLTK